MRNMASKSSLVLSLWLSLNSDYNNHNAQSVVVVLLLKGPRIVI